jgi:hypothetical protein
VNFDGYDFHLNVQVDTSTKRLLMVIHSGDHLTRWAGAAPFRLHLKVRFGGTVCATGLDKQLGAPKAGSVWSTASSLVQNVSELPPETLTAGNCEFIHANGWIKLWAVIDDYSTN